MAIRLELVGKQLEPARLTYTWRDTVIYALGVGARIGELDYLYEGRGPKVLPTFAVVPSFRAIHQVIGELGVPPLSILHGEQTIRLDNLSPRPNLILVRQRLFKKSLAVASISAAAAVVFDRYGTNIAQWVVYGFVAVALAAGTVTMLSYPKVMFARFMTRAGKAGLDVARAGPDRAAFQDFVEQMQRQIRRR